MFEYAGIGDACRVKSRLAADLRYGDERQLLAHALALRGIVIVKGDGFQAEVQRFGNRLQIAGLVQPIRLKNGDMLLFQQHFGMDAEWFARNGVRVLGANGKHYAAPSQIHDEALEVGIRLTLGGGLTQPDARDTVIAAPDPPR